MELRRPTQGLPVEDARAAGGNAFRPVSKGARIEDQKRGALAEHSRWRIGTWSATPCARQLTVTIPCFCATMLEAAALRSMNHASPWLISFPRPSISIFAVVVGRRSQGRP